MGEIDVVLSRPRDLNAVPPGAPVQDALGVGYLSSKLRAAGCKVAVVDAHALDLDSAGLAECIRALTPRVVGLSLHAFSDFKHCLSVSKSLFKDKNRPLCIWGGEHATFFAERILKEHPEVDGVVLSEGEETFTEIVCGHLQMARNNAVAGWVGEAVEGAILRDSKGTIIDGRYRSAIDALDDLPRPDKDIVEVAIANEKQVTLSILTGRGCYHRCRFCTAHEFMRLGGGRVWRRRSPKLVADELQSLAEKYLGHPLVHPVVQFQDVIFLGTSRAARRWVEEYLDELEERNLAIPFYCMTRADSVIANHDLFPRLVNVGLRSVEVGIESGIDRVLQSYNKRNSADENEKAVEILRQHGVAYDASGFIMFDPYMTLEELRTNAHYLARFGAATWDFFVTQLQLYPGTELREEMISKGLMDSRSSMDDMAHYEFLDSRVAEVASAAYYYHPRIRTLDLRLRDAKAVVAAHIRAGRQPPKALSNAIEVVHKTYCNQLLDLISAAEDEKLVAAKPALVRRFMDRVDRLTELMVRLCPPDEQRRPKFAT